MIPNQQGLFIAGSLGKLEIAKEDYDTFRAAIKELEWTDNNLYKFASSSEVKPIIVQSESLSYPKINFNEFYIEESYHLEDFKKYINEIESKRVNQQDKLFRERQDFCKNFLDGKDPMKKNEMLEMIKFEKKKIIANSNLKDKLGRYLTYLS